MEVTLIQVPYHAGDERHGSSDGPGRFVAAGAVDVFSARGLDVALDTIDRGGPFRDTAASAAQVNRRLADVVRQAVEPQGLSIAPHRLVESDCSGFRGIGDRCRVARRSPIFRKLNQAAFATAIRRPRRSV